MKRQIIITSDGSTTIHLPAWNENYHSSHGAIQEAYHVFIEMGYKSIEKDDFSILEIGFGTGLNAFITLLETAKDQRQINYVGVEAYPVREDELLALNYVSELDTRNLSHKFEEMHLTPWNKPQEVTPNFTLTKRQMFFHNLHDVDAFDLIYFDAFGARVQPDLWTEEIFALMYTALKPGGKIVTYAAKGSVRRAMQTVGFAVERLPGPPGKREMLRGTKNS
ncbi:SAM-dependent methyltransferase [Wenyingzhuangia fucanilytica]|uniref:SAM-dependent methyltransferase n=1 Tax=Wenyingzhuangia fucanilytica TaxID=1790137 RepID=A0A1B1Y7Q3_9FLAO|nr:tRNA (5-methylaminomethyl-2-thiouridine)(34)-methyltransferase MnmD [Wenyingzhuangia fucanilytica]ANW96764.1 SAM-dependent methyltransferase [Wenyingzhuangia fucanilytica]